jgi:hypothetical protein
MSDKVASDQIASNLETNSGEDSPVGVRLSR